MGKEKKLNEEQLKKLVEEAMIEEGFFDSVSQWNAGRKAANLAKQTNKQYGTETQNPEVRKQLAVFNKYYENYAKDFVTKMQAMEKQYLQTAVKLFDDVDNLVNSYTQNALALKSKAKIIPQSVSDSIDKTMARLQNSERVLKQVLREPVRYFDAVTESLGSQIEQMQKELSNPETAWKEEDTAKETAKQKSREQEKKAQQEKQ